MLLGRPWIHKISVVSSTLHQCFKYCKKGQVKTIVADAKQFIVAEAHFSDAKLYLNNASIEYEQPTLVSNKMGKKSFLKKKKKSPRR